MGISIDKLRQKVNGNRADAADNTANREGISIDKLRQRVADNRERKEQDAAERAIRQQAAANLGVDIPVAGGTARPQSFVNGTPGNPLPTTSGGAPLVAPAVAKEQEDFAGYVADLLGKTADGTLTQDDVNGYKDRYIDMAATNMAYATVDAAKKAEDERKQAVKESLKNSVGGVGTVSITPQKTGSVFESKQVTDKPDGLSALTYVGGNALKMPELQDNFDQADMQLSEAQNKLNFAWQRYADDVTDDKRAAVYNKAKQDYDAAFAAYDQASRALREARADIGYKQAYAKQSKYYGDYAKAASDAVSDDKVTDFSKSLTLQSAQSLANGGSGNEYSGNVNRLFLYGTDKQKKVYLYLLDKDKKAAELFASDVSPLVNLTLQDAYAKNYKKQGKLGRFTMAALTQPTAGVNDFIQGGWGLIKALTGDDSYTFQTALQSAAGGVRSAEKGFAAGALMDAARSAGNMAPAIAIGSVTGGIAGPAVGTAIQSIAFGGSAAGNAYIQAINDGYNHSEALCYGAISGASEVFLERLIGGVAGFGASGASRFASSSAGKAISARIAPLFGKASAKLSPNVQLAFRAFGHAMADMSSEAVEESMQELLDPLFKNIIMREDNRIFTAENMQNALYAGLLGALTAGILNVPSNMGWSNTISSLIKGKATDADIDAVLKDNSLRGAFESIAGFKLPSDTESARMMLEMWRAGAATDFAAYDTATDYAAYDGKNAVEIMQMMSDNADTANTDGFAVATPEQYDAVMREAAAQNGEMPFIPSRASRAERESIINKEAQKRSNDLLWDAVNRAAQDVKQEAITNITVAQSRGDIARIMQDNIGKTIWVNGERRTVKGGSRGAVQTVRADGSVATDVLPGSKIDYTSRGFVLTGKDGTKKTFAFDRDTASQMRDKAAANRADDVTDETQGGGQARTEQPSKAPKALTLLDILDARLNPTYSATYTGNKKNDGISIAEERQEAPESEKTATIETEQQIETLLNKQHDSDIADKQPTDAKEDKQDWTLLAKPIDEQNGAFSPADDGYYYFNQRASYNPSDSAERNGSFDINIPVGDKVTRKSVNGKIIGGYGICAKDDGKFAVYDLSNGFFVHDFDNSNDAAAYAKYLTDNGIFLDAFPIKKDGNQYFTAISASKDIVSRLNDIYDNKTYLSDVQPNPLDTDGKTVYNADTEEKSDTESVSGVMQEDNTNQKSGYVLDGYPRHTITEQNHTKTGEPIYVLRTDERVSDDEYKRLKDKIKEIGGYYSKFVKGFIVPREIYDAYNAYKGNASQNTSKIASDANSDAGMQSVADNEKTKQTAENGESIAEETDKTNKSENKENETEESAPIADGADERSRKVSDFVLRKLTDGAKISNTDLMKVANEAFGGSMANGDYTVKDLYDALELGINRYILSLPPEKLTLDTMERILDLIPTQTKRTSEQETYQQFSTPPTLAYLASRAAGITRDDVVLEPSAGIGSLAVFAKAAGAEVIVNELDGRRLSVLKNLPFDGFFNENAEQIDNILGDKISPSVVVMNPPFSSSASTGIKGTKVGAAHVEQALKILADGGRLVAIVGQGMSDTAPSFRSWWKGIKENYNVVANIGIDGKNYAKFGTTFGVRLLVIDKTGKTENTLTKDVGTVDELQKVLEGLSNARTGRRDEGVRVGRGVSGVPQATVRNAVAEGAGVRSEDTDVNGKGEQRAVSDARKGTDGTSGTGSGDVGNEADVSAASGETDTERLDAGRVSAQDAESDRGVGTSGPADTGIQSDRRISDQRLHDGTDGNRPGSESRDGRSAGGERSGTAGDDRGLRDDRGSVGLSDERHVQSDDIRPESPRIEDTPKNEKVKKELTDNVYEEYVPSALPFKNAKKHPAKISESAAMNAVKSPKITYKPNLPESVTDTGVLSDVQLEAVCLAGQSGEQINGDGSRRGFFIGDGTGVGKGRTVSGIILDNYNSGRKKAIWITKNDSLADDSQRDLKAVFGSSDMMFKFKGGNGAKALSAQNDGIMFLTYGKLSKNYTEKGSNLDKIVEWFGKDYDGVIVMDEAHEMANAIGKKGARGKTKPSQAALSGIALQKALPNARVVYASATGATDIGNLAYAERLGLWGNGTPFATVTDFVNKISSGGVAAMEMVARDLKAMGLYLSRNISYDGVKYERLVHNLTKDQREMYDTCADAWQTVLQNVEKALEVTRSGGKGGSRGAVNSAFWGYQQRFFNQMILSFQVPSLIKDMEKQLKNGKSCVVQLTSTNEAMMNRKLEEAKKNGEDIDDLEFSPRELLSNFLEKAFPVIQYEEYIDDKGNRVSREVKDANGNPVLNREAVKMRDELMDKIGLLNLPSSPIDQIIDYFGEDLVAENTGRSRRILTKDGSKKEFKLTQRQKDADVEAFQNGKKRIILFSEAGGTGKSYHADRNAKNQQQRVHYLFEAGWKADAAVQGLGRCNRSNQVLAPIYKLVTTDLRGQMRFISTIAKRLDSLGAMTKGQRQAGSNGIFDASDNLESDLSKDVLAAFYRDLYGNLVEDVHDGRSIIRKLGLEHYFIGSNGSFNDSSNALRDISKFLNRILVLKYDEQNSVFEAFANRLAAATDEAAAAGTLDRGLENFKADSVSVSDVQSISVDEKTGAETLYYNMSVKNRVKPMLFDDIDTQADNFLGFFRSRTSGAVKAAYKSANMTDKNGSVSARTRLISVAGTREYMETFRFKANWVELPVSEARNLWNEQVGNLPEYRESTLHLISGVILPIWDKLPADNPRIYRVMTDDGNVLIGRMVKDADVDRVLSLLGKERNKQEVTTERAIAALNANDKIMLENGMVIKRSLVSGEYRYEIQMGSQSTIFMTDRLKNIGAFTERIASKTRVFIPTGKASEVLKSVFKEISPVRNIVDSSESSVQYRKDADNAAVGENSALRGSSSRITPADVEALRSVGRKSVNDFSPADIKKAEPFARRYWEEMGTKSPFFRAWFGDWRAYDNSPVKIADIPEYVATNEARKSNRGVIRNEDTEWDIRISREGETNTISHSGEGRLSEYGLSGIKQLMENAVLLDSEVHEHHSNNAQNDRISFDHKLYALGNTNGSLALYKITVEEFFQSKSEPSNKKFHNLKYIEKVAELPADALAENFRSGGSTNGNSATVYSISDLLDFVKKFDKDFSAGKAVNPTMLNDNGTPKVEYQEDYLSSLENVAAGAGSKNGSTSFRHTEKDRNEKEWKATKDKGNTSDVKPISEIVLKIAKHYGIPIRTGNYYGSHAGQYNQKTGSIRTALTNDLPTISHELGHALDARFSLSDSENIGEAIDLLDADFAKQYRKDEVPEEALAEFVRIYLSSRDEARRIAPAFFAEFESKLGKELAFVTELAQNINAYLGENIEIRYARSSLTDNQIKEMNRKTLPQKLRMWADSIIDTFVDDKAQTKRNLKAYGVYDESNGTKNAYVLQTNAANAHARAAANIKYRLSDLDGNPLGKSLMERLKPVQNEMGAFDDYLKARHALEWRDPPEGIKPKQVYGDADLDNPDNIREHIAKFEEKYPHFKQTAQDVYDYMDKIMYYYGVASGMESESVYRYLRQTYPSYVPFYRAMVETVGNTQDIASNTSKGVKSGFANQSSNIKRAKGSGRETRSILENIVTFTDRVVVSAIRNQAASALADVADTVEGFAPVMERVTPNMIPYVFDISQQKANFGERILKIIKNSDDTDAVADAMNEIFDDKLISFMPVTSGNKRIVTVRKNGKNAYYQINDIKQYEVLAALSPQELKTGLKVMNKIMGIVKMGLTQYNPLFAMYNMMRDFKTAWYNTDTNNLIAYIGNYFCAMKEGLSRSEDFMRFMAMGGGHSSDLENNFDTIQKNLQRMFAKDPKNTALRFMRVLNPAVINNLVEITPRFMEFKGQLKKTSDANTAMFKADDITTNFKRHGKNRSLNASFMFSNAQIQGLDRLYRSFADATPKERRARIVKYIMTGLIMTALEMFWNRRDDEERDNYENLSRYMKNSYYVFSIGNGRYIRIPKPREHGILSTAMERVCDFVLDGDYSSSRVGADMIDFGGYVFENLMPVFLPSDFSSVENATQSLLSNTLLGGVTDIMANRDFKGSPIVSGSYEYLPESEQYNGSTSRLAVAIGGALNYSPLKIDYLMKNYGGWFGYLASYIAPMDESNRDLTLGFKGRMTADSRYSTDVFNGVYEKRDALEKQVKQEEKVSDENKASSGTLIQLESANYLAAFTTNMRNAVRNMDATEEEKRDALFLCQQIIKASDDSVSEGQKYAMQLYEATGDEDIFYRTFSNNLTYKIDIDHYEVILTPEQYISFANEVENAIESCRLKVKKGADFREMSDSAKVAKIVKLTKDAVTKIKTKYAKEYGTKK